MMINDLKFSNDSYKMKNWCKLNEFDSIFSNQSKSTLYVSELIIRLSKKWIVSFSFSFLYSMIHWWIFLLKSNLIRKWNFWFSNFLIESFRFCWMWLIDQQSIFSHTKHFFWRWNEDLNDFRKNALRDFMYERFRSR